MRPGEADAIDEVIDLQHAQRQITFTPFPTHVMAEKVVAVIESTNDHWSRVPQSSRPQRTLSVVTDNAGTFNIWFVAMYDGVWHENASHYSSTPNLPMALVHASYQALNDIEGQ